MRAEVFDLKMMSTTRKSTTWLLLTGLIGLWLTKKWVQFHPEQGSWVVWIVIELLFAAIFLGVLVRAVYVERKSGRG